MSTIVVRYRAIPERAAENQRLVEEVFEELDASRPDGLRYAAYLLADGTFLHIAEVTADPNPLGGIAAFARFQEGIGDRCEPGAGPDPQQASLVGSYRFFAGDSDS